MKHLKSYKLYESNSQLDIKSMVNWDVIEDIRHISLDYIDNGHIIEEYNIFLNVIPLDDESDISLKNSPWEKNRDDNESSNKYLIYSGYFDNKTDEFIDVLNYNWDGGSGSEFVFYRNKLKGLLKISDNLNLDYLISYEVIVSEPKIEEELVNRLKEIYPKENITQVKNIEE